MSDEFQASHVTCVANEEDLLGKELIEEADRVYQENAPMDQILEKEEEEATTKSLMEIFIQEFIEEDNLQSLLLDLAEEVVEEEERKRGPMLEWKKIAEPIISIPSSITNVPTLKKGLTIIPQEFRLEASHEGEIERLVGDEEKRRIIREVLAECLATGLRMQLLTLNITEHSPLETQLSLELRHYAYLSAGGEKHIAQKFLKEQSLVIRFNRPYKRNKPNIFIDVIIRQRQ